MILTFLCTIHNAQRSIILFRSQTYVSLDMKLSFISQKIDNKMSNSTIGHEKDALPLISRMMESIPFFEEKENRKVQKQTLFQYPIYRATIDLEPKVRTAEQNLILLPKKITNVSVCTTNVRSYVCLFTSRNHLFHQCLILDFLVVIITKNVFFACVFLESIKC